MVVATAIAMIGSLTPAASAAPSTAELTKKIEAASNQLEDITESFNKLNIELAKTVADQKALADTTFRSWLHHGGEHRGKGKTKGKDGKAAAAPAASAPAQP